MMCLAEVWLDVYTCSSLGVWIAFKPTYMKKEMRDHQHFMTSSWHRQRLTLPDLLVLVLLSFGLLVFYRSKLSVSSEISVQETHTELTGRRKYHMVTHTRVSACIYNIYMY